MVKQFRVVVLHQEIIRNPLLLARLHFDFLVELLQFLALAGVAHTLLEVVNRQLHRLHKDRLVQNFFLGEQAAQHVEAGHSLVQRGLHLGLAMCLLLLQVLLFLFTAQTLAREGSVNELRDEASREQEFAAVLLVEEAIARLVGQRLGLQDHEEGDKLDKV